MVSISLGRTGELEEAPCEGRIIPFSLSVVGGLGVDPLLSLQVKSSLRLIPDHLPLLKLCPPGTEEGKGGLPGKDAQRWPP